MWRVFLCLTVVLLAGEATARDLFVNNVTGDDRRNGVQPLAITGETGPLRTIRRALRLAGPADRIVIANTGQPYRESITLQAANHSGAFGTPFIIEGNGAILDGSAPIPLELWQHVEGDLYRFQPRRKDYQMLLLGGVPAVRHPAEGDVPELQPLEWTLVRGFLYFRTEPGKAPYQYDLALSSMPVGITLYEVRDVILSDLVVQGFQLDGINAHDNVFGATLVGITSRGNGRSGISVGGASRVQIEACLVGSNGEAQVRTEGFSKTRIINCDLLEESAPALLRAGGEVFVKAEE